MRWIFGGVSSEYRWRVEGERFTRRWVAKRQQFGMQVETFGTFAVERIAKDGAAEPVGMGTVDA